MTKDHTTADDSDPNPIGSSGIQSDQNGDRSLPENQNSERDLGGVWKQFGDQLRRRARTRLRQYGLAGQAESMDICNDVMADLARRGPAVNEPDEVLRYIFRAIDHQVLDTFRTLARQCRDFRRNESTPVDEMGMEGRLNTPSRIALRREVLEKIREHMSQEDARALDLMLENRDWIEIGEILNIAPDTARMRVRRAIARVRDVMAGGSNADSID